MHPPLVSRAARGTHPSNEAFSPERNTVYKRLSAGPPLSSRNSATLNHRKTQSDITSPRSSTLEYNDDRNVTKIRPTIDTPLSSPPDDPTEREIDDNASARSHYSNHMDFREPGFVYDRLRLANRLRGVFRQDVVTQHNFVPKSDLDSLITQLSVNQELDRIEYLPARIRHRTWRSITYVRISQRNGIPPRKSATSHSADARFQKIFAILLLIGCPKRIWSFVKEKVCDDDLPLCKTERIDQADRKYELRRDVNSSTPLSCLKKAHEISGFVDYQWRVLAPCFGRSDEGTVSHLKCADAQILPLVHRESETHEGGSGEVFQVVLHPGHHTFDSKEAPGNVVAVKKLHSTKRKAFEQESRVLRGLSKERHVHDHLIRLLATFEHKGHFYLMFPWASKDLRTYWESYAECNETCFKWLLEQCHGIVEALTSIHRYQTTSATSIASTTNLSSSNPNSKFGSQESNEDLDQRNAWSLWGRHGDITPTNILFFPDQSQDGKYGTLKLADFGAARFSYDDTITKEDKCNVPGSRAYCSPEWRLPDGKPTVQCDVWALGCIFLEFVCWYFDYRYLKGFERERLSVDDTAYFFSFLMPDKPRPGVAWVKKPVSEMLTKMHERSNSSDSKVYLQRFLDIIQNHMLVVQSGSLAPLHEGDETNTSTPSSPMHEEGRERKSSGNIARDLGSILHDMKRAPEGMAG